MTFTGSQFRDKYEIEPRTWYRNLHSVTEYIYFTRLILSKLTQIIYSKNGVEMIRSVIKYFLSVCLFSLGFTQVDYDTQIQPIFGNDSRGSNEIDPNGWDPPPVEASIFREILPKICKKF